MILVGNGAVYNEEAQSSTEVNERVYWEIIVSVDPVSCDLINFDDGKVDGKKGLKVLREIYLDAESDLDMSLVVELFHLEMCEEETGLEYIGRVDCRVSKKSLPSLELFSNLHTKPLLNNYSYFLINSYSTNFLHFTLTFAHTCLGMCVQIS